jgi:hypothetical protein
MHRLSPKLVAIGMMIWVAPLSAQQRAAGGGYDDPKACSSGLAMSGEQSARDGPVLDASRRGFLP